MSTHITNIVEFHGEEQRITQFLNAVKNDEFGVGTIDFEKVIPMPADHYPGPLGKREQELYGNRNWLDFSLANWGCKGNAYGYPSNSDRITPDRLFFVSGYSAPHMILEKLSQMYPDIKFSHEWASDDLGMNCGRHEYYGGERIEEYYPESDKDRYEFAARVLDLDLELDCAMYLNASETGYINIEGDDEYELVELFGQPALFTNDRITDADIPKGMHCYHIRHDDEGNFCELEKRVGVNHAGSVVTKEPIALGEQGYISFTEDTSPNFTGNVMSLYEFREYSPGESEDMGMEMKQ